MVAEQGLQAPSFQAAAAAFGRAVGEDISADSVRRLTEGFGAQVEARRAGEVEAAFALEGPADPVELVEPVEERGNLSSDGTMLRVRGEGYKEVKLTVLSECTVTPGEGDADPRVRLHKHSCQAGLWDADTLGRYQYVEGLRRGLGSCEELTSVNDAAAWIGRVTGENYPQAVQIVDWGHAAQRVWAAAQALHGEGSEAAREWAQRHQATLWQGSAVAVAEALAPDAHQEAVRTLQGYLRGNAERMHYAAYRCQGYPIGSGTVESAGKNYVQHRMKRSGPGWNRPTGQAMLSALSELHSGRFDLAWEQCA